LWELPCNIQNPKDMKEVYALVWDKDIMGIYSCWTKANNYIERIEEKLDTTLFDVQVIPLLIDTDYHFDEITQKND